MQKTLLSNLKSNERFHSYFMIVLGSLVGGMAYPLFLVPNHIAPGGITGVATIFNYLWHWPVGVVSLLLNIPVFLFGYASIGRTFVLRSLIATVLFSVFIDIFPFPPLTNDMMLASLLGGVMLGLGLGMILRGGATTGGSDMLAKTLHKYIPFISVGLILFSIDFIVILAAAFTVNSDAALYALINIYLSAKTVDIVIAGFGTAKACYIVTPHTEAVSSRILNEMERGATLLHAKGAYSGDEKNVILCVVSNRETAKLKKVVRAEDPSAFMFVTDTHETLGEGFSPWNE